MIINGNIQAVAGAYGVANVKSRASVAAIALLPLAVGPVITGMTISGYFIQSS